MANWSPPERLKVEESSLSEKERELSFDPHDLEVQRADYVSQTYKRVSKNERKQFTKSLSKDDEGDFDRVYEYLNDWKDPAEYSPKAAESWELLAKDTLKIPTNVRNNGKNAEEPTQPQIKTFGELYTATQCFLSIHFGTKNEPATKEIHRGIREKSIAKLVAQVIDNPNCDQYHFYTSALSNHTGLEGVGFHHSEGVVITMKIPREKVAFAPDRLINTPAHEDEFQLVGGVIDVGSKNIIQEGSSSGETRRLTTLIQRMDSPEGLHDDEHRDIADLVEIMYENEESVTSSEGADRLQNWRHEVDSREIFSSPKRSLLKAQVQYLAEAGQSPD